MADLPTFKAQFPEFVSQSSARDPFLQSFLNAAALEIDPVVWGNMTDQGIYYLAAHKLAISPSGNSAKLIPKTSGYQSTTYGQEWELMLSKVASGYGTT
jgi:hypothetical protein